MKRVKLKDCESIKIFLYFQNKTKFSDEYNLMDRIGSGGFGTVYKWFNKKNNSIWAVKMISKSNMSEHRLTKIAKEVKIIRDLDHPNIVKIYENFEDDKNLYIVSEFIKGGELLSELVRRGSFTEKDWARVIRQVLEALNYLHLNNIAHKDLKPGNTEFNIIKLFFQLNLFITKMYNFISICSF